MHVEFYDSLEPTLAEWSDLFRADPAATPFMSPLWAQAWWRTWAGSAEPLVATVREDGRLVGLSPFVVRRRGPWRVLSEPGGHPRRDVLALPGARPQVAQAIAEGLLRRRKEWDVLMIRRFPGTSAIEPSLREAGLRSRVRGTAAYPGIQLPGSFAEYLDSLPRKRRKDLRRHLRRLDEGVLALREVDEPREIEAATRRWQELKIQWWEARGARIHPSQRHPRFAGFLSDLMKLLVPAGSGEVWELRQSETVVGIEISLLDRGTFYSWQGGYEPTIAQLGPGKLAIGEGIRRAIEAGRSYYDLMRGAQDYKAWYGATEQLAQSVAWSNARMASQAAVLTMAALARARRRSARHPPELEEAATG